MINRSDFFWWKLELLVFKEVEESLLWKLETLGINSFSIEHLPNNSSNPTLFIWLASFEWSKKDLKDLEMSLCSLANVFNKKLLHFQWKKIANEDWSSTWKKLWTPDPVGEKLLILPSRPSHISFAVVL